MRPNWRPRFLFNMFKQQSVSVEGLFKQYSVSGDELSADSCPAEI